MKRTIILQAPAKINLGLWVKEKRPDGYHEIETIMQSLTLADSITLHETREPGIHIECRHPGVPPGPGNIAYKAAMAVYERFDLPPGLAISIDKQIPVAAGLAGGSTDAAAVMSGLVRLLGKSLPLPDLMTLGQTIGSDVPFVIKGGLAHGTGRGETLAFFDSPKPPLVVVIAVPKGLEVSTRWAYENYHPGDNARKAARFADILPAFKRRDLATLRQVAFNDLESVTLQRHPEVAHIKDILSSTGQGFVMMSGSGPSVFGLFDDKRAAVAAASKLNRDTVDIFIEHTMRSSAH
jgi:4-diphosphocytidyl-2-C-methyl-D-erythritol kinase